MKSKWLARTGLVVGFVTPLVFSSAPTAAQTTIRVSVASDGTEANGDSGGGITAGGRYVYFRSDATNLVPDDTNGTSDHFMHDLVTGKTERLRFTPEGVKPNDEIINFSISPDGRFIAFTSLASNLVPDDTNGVPGTLYGTDVFVHDRQTGVTERVSVAPDGSQGISDHSGSRDPSISADGRYVAFYTTAHNLVPRWDTFASTIIRDRTTGQNAMIKSAWGPQLSADGRYVAFQSGDFFPGISGQMYRYDRQTGAYLWVSPPYDGSEPSTVIFPVRISANGNFVTFETHLDYMVPGDTNGIPDVFVRDIINGRTERVSVASGGGQAINHCCIGSSGGSLSADGRYVSFTSPAGNLVPNDTNGPPSGPGPPYGYDVFVHDRQTRQTERVSVAADGSQANAPSHGGSMSFDGRVVSFISSASNLVPNDTNGKSDVFLRIRWAAVVPGDVDGNGQVTVDDARMLVRLAAGLESASGDHLTRGDLDGDRALTLMDAARLMRGL